MIDYLESVIADPWAQDPTRCTEPLIATIGAQDLTWELSLSRAERDAVIEARMKAHWKEV